MESQDRIKRLLSYRNLLTQLQNLGFVKVFSDNIADSLGLSASLVRKDFAVFGISGTQKGGYEVATILEKINSILGKDRVHKVIIVGVGRLGRALLLYSQGFADEGIRIVAGFDIDPEKFDPNAEVPILPLSKMSEFIRAEAVKFAIVTVPDAAARQVIDLLKAEHVQGILNFTSLKVKSTEETIISQVNIEHELARLIYTVNSRNIQQ
ncbi:MAG: redox-sensing transcriptional repressor Rex [candidate division KSB1 bacterium]|nr:redox-sensing transcriptional repressor Rex [candidate division KSB1 bacterium]MDZ7345490.1 redox-sensing transcriptional repressor Rex [candidate division KSB1 bacterium]